MSLWEYKVISSGKGGFATPALLEKFLNDLGRDEWEIVEFRTAPENPLAFSGLARRSTQRDWTLQDAAAAAAKAEAEKLRAEFEAKFKAATSSASENAAGIERTPSFLEEKAAPDDGFRKPIDTSHDDEPETAEDKEEDEWDKLTAAEEDELPTFFEAIKPHMRRNQRGPGMSVGVDYLAKKWDQNEEDLIGALKECGFEVPDDEDATPVYLEYDGDLYWLNVNRRGELWINTKEKPRQVFRPVKAQRIEVEAPAPKEKDETRAAAEAKAEGEAKPENGDRKPEAGDAPAEGAGAEQPAQNAKPQNGGGGGPLPQGAELLAKIRPHMRRNRRGPGGSGSASFLARALRTNEAELRSAFAALGLTLPSSPNEKPVYSEIGNEVWWLNVDSRGGVWINGRDKKPGETLAPKGEAPAAATPAETTGEIAPAPAEGPAPAAEAASSGAAVTPENPSAESPAPSAPVSEAVPSAETSASPSPVSEPAASPAAEPVLPPVAPAPTEQPAMPAAAVETPAPAAPAPAPAESAAPASNPDAAPAAETSAPAETSSDTANPITGAPEGEEEKKPRRSRSRKKSE